MTYEDCKACEGRGWRMYQNGPDDFDKDVCEICGGSGKLAVNVKDLELDTMGVGESYKCPKCGEFELRAEKIGNKDVPFRDWTKTGLWICDNPDCGAELKEDKKGNLELE